MAFYKFSVTVIYENIALGKICVLMCIIMSHVLFGGRLCPKGKAAGQRHEFV